MAFLNGALGQSSLLERKQVLLPTIAVLTAAVAGGLITARQPLLVVVGVLAVPLAIAIISQPAIATLIVIFVLYTNAAVVAVKFHGVPFIVGASYIILLIIPLANYLVIRRQKLVINPVLPLIFIFLAIQVFGALASKDIGLAMPRLVEFVYEGIALYFLFTNVVRTPERLRQVIWVLLIAGAIMGGIPFYQQITQTFDNNYGGFAQITSTGFNTGESTLQGEVRQPRLAGAIGEQNRYAQIMLMLVPLGLFRFWGEQSKRLRVLALVATGLIALGVVLAFSRGAAVGFVLMLLIMVFLRLIRPYQFVIFVLGAVLVLAALPQYSQRLASIQSVSAFVSEGGAIGAGEPDGAIKGRVTEMLAAALVFADHPVIGVGPGMFKYYAQEYANNMLDIRTLTGTREAHSLYLGIVAENGALGLICFLAILYLTLRNLARTRQRWAQKRPELANMATGFMLAIISYMTTGIFLHLSYVRYFWLMLALAGAASYVAGNPAGERTQVSPPVSVAAKAEPNG